MHTTAKLIKIVVAAVIVVILVMLLLWKCSADKPLLPDRAPTDVDENAITTNDDEAKIDAPPDGGGTSFDYAKEIVIDLTTGTADLYFKNPGKSLYDAAIFLVVDDTVVLQSDLLPPGSLLTSLPLPEDNFPLQQGGYDAELWVQSYDENGDALSVNFRLEGFTINVK